MSRNPSSARFTFSTRTRIFLALLFVVFCATALVLPAGAFKFGGAGKSSTASFRDRENAEAQSLAPDSEEKEDVDAGPMGRGGLSFRDYLERRERMTELLRGLPSDALEDLRARAIRQLEQASATAPKSSTSADAASVGTPLASASSPNWTSIGPEPIPDGQTNLIDATRNPVSGRVL